MTVLIGPTSETNLMVQPRPGKTGHNALGVKPLVLQLPGLVGKELPHLDGNGLDVRMVKTGKSLCGGSQNKTSLCFLLYALGTSFAPLRRFAHSSFNCAISLLTLFGQTCPVCGKSMHSTPTKASQRPFGDRHIFLGFFALNVFICCHTTH